MRHFNLIVLTVILVSSCDTPTLEFDDNKRILVKGKIDYTGGESVAGINVIAEVLINSGIFSGTTNNGTIGMGRTDENGFYEFVILSPTAINNLKIKINSPLFDGHNEQINGLDVEGIPLSEIKENTLELPNLPLVDIRQVELTFERTSNMTDTLNYTITHRKPSNNIRFDDNNLDNIDAVKTEFSGFLLPIFSNSSRPIEVVANDTLLFEYTLKNNGQTDAGQLNLIANQNTGNYVFEF